jgi:hypothetical protein
MRSAAIMVAGLLLGMALMGLAIDRVAPPCPECPECRVLRTPS